MSRRIVVVGGGISGLSVAHRLTGDVKVTIVEASHRLGGWIRSERNVGVCASLLEAGPRTLRPSGMSGLETLHLIGELGLEKEMVVVSKASPAARNRFLLYRGRLCRLPSSLLDALRSNFDRDSPVYRIIPALMRETMVAKGGNQDESIDAFFKRRFGDAVAEHLATAMVHGIYSGDSRELSIRSCFPSIWNAETSTGSVVSGMLRGNARQRALIDEQKRRLKERYGDIWHMTKDASIYSFRNGMETLVEALVNNLDAHPNVAIHTATKCVKVQPTSSGIMVLTEGGATMEADHVIVTTPAYTLPSVIPGIPLVETSIPSANVAVVNLVYKTPGILPVQGFGYLVPRSEPSAILGVVFDSDAVPGQDATPQTRLTAMIGGARFKQAYGIELKDATMDVLERVARDAVQKDLGIKEDPVTVRVHVQNRCIPQYPVGHHLLRDKIDTWVRGSDFAGKLSFTGASWKGVSMNDCIYYGRRLADDLLKGTNRSVITGLEDINA